MKSTRQIYETVTKTEPHRATIAEKDDLSIYARYDEGYSMALSRFRSTGMLINTKAESLPHYAVVIIVNDVGEMKLSKTLREAEPPQHTEWKSTNITDNSALRSLAKTYITRINRAIQKVLDEFERADITERMDAGIGGYLPDASEMGAESGTDGLRTDVKISEISSYNGRFFTVINMRAHLQLKVLKYPKMAPRPATLREGKGGKRRSRLSNRVAKEKRVFPKETVKLKFLR